MLLNLSIYLNLVKKEIKDDKEEEEKKKMEKNTACLLGAFGVRTKVKKKKT